MHQMYAMSCKTTSEMIFPVQKHASGIRERTFVTHKTHIHWTNINSDACDPTWQPNDYWSGKRIDESLF